METETKNPKEEDGQAVAAVRDGDAERYRELVERHERRVYAITWSRLGDAALAEEATQEAFIRGYRGLKLLGNGRKFSGWIAAIARNVAINLGLRHRRELKKRERWALEQVDADEAASDDPSETFAPETLRQTLEELPAKHRECLVLFYLEGKDGAESAAVLGVTEAAFRVRLHRARGALRKHLEARLAGSLENLRPGRSLVPLIMSAILTSSTTKAMAAGGTGMTVLGSLVKLSPLKWLLPLMPLFLFVPMAYAQSKSLQEEAQNFKDRDGFRAGIYREQMNPSFRKILLLSLALVCFIAILQWMPLAYETSNLLIGIFGLGCVLSEARFLRINRTFYARVMTVSSAPLFVVAIGAGMGWVPHFAFHMSVMFQLLLMSLVVGKRPTRMDYNLFIRAATGLLENRSEKKTFENSSGELSKKGLFEMARFLGSLWLVDGFRWSSDGLMLRLARVRFFVWSMGFPGRWSNRSKLLLRWDGTVAACLSSEDRDSLVFHAGQGVAADEAIESKVAAAVEESWAALRVGCVEQAEKLVGQVLESEIYKAPPSKTGPVRARVAMMVVPALVVIVFWGLLWLQPVWLSGLKVVSTTEEEVRRYFEEEAFKPSLPKGNPVVGAAGYYFTLPSTNMLSSAALRSLRDKLSRQDRSFEELKGSRERHGWIWSWEGRVAIGSRWIWLDDLRIDPAVATGSAPWSPSTDQVHQYWNLLQRYSVRSQDGTKVFNVYGLARRNVVGIRLLDELDGLHLIDKEVLVSEIIGRQIVSKPKDKDPRVANWRGLRGLFWAGRNETLQQTYYCVAALEILGGLDRIDQEACIKGILRRHSGKGYFDSPVGGNFNSTGIRGDAQDTIAAFESLRILGALDRVDDLKEWEFRVRKGRGEDGELNWAIVSAWVAKQRLERFLWEREENPDAPARSLLEP